MRRGVALVAVGLACVAGAVQAHAQSALSFHSPSVLSGATGFEPEIATDGQGNWVDSAPQGFPSGQGAYWFSNDDGATWSTPSILGGAAGGGDEADVYAPYDGSPYAGELYISDLAAADTTICYSMDHGKTFWAAGTGPNSPANAPDPNQCKAETAQGAAGPSNDRQWITTDKGGRAYLSYHEFVSAQPVMFTTTDGGGDGFAQPCGSPIDPTNPLMEQYVPQDISGGTLISQPVVDANGTIYELITTTTQQENGGALQNSTLSGTFSELFLAVSTDHCTTFKDYTVFDGYGSNLPCQQVPTCNTDQFGDIFNQIKIDSAGDLYATAAGFVGTTPFATTTDIYLFSHRAGDPLGTWSGPNKLTNDGNGHMLPTLTPGPTPGQLAVGFFRTVNGVSNPNDTSGQWAFSVLETQDALAGSAAAWTSADVPGGSGTNGNLFHLGDICNSGTLCGTGAPGTGSDRSLGDFTSAVTATDGCPVFSFAGNPVQGGATNTYVAKQATDCFAAPAANLPEVPLPGLLLGAGAAAIGAVLSRRRRVTDVAVS